MNKVASITISILLFAGCFHSSFANNLTISTSPVLTGHDVTNHTVYVKFDISWDNSWRTSTAPNNWDAAWVFVKYKVGSGVWQHATISSVGNTAPSGITIDVSSDTVGAFIYRSSDGGPGSVSFTNVFLRWNYGADGVADNANVTVKVFGIEMVYVPQGSFYVGSGGTEPGSLTNGSWTSGNYIPFQITSESALTIGHSAGNLWADSTSSYDGGHGTPGTLSVNFPKGYNAFYCMKYSISQEEYVGFLNTLDGTQQASRVSAVTSGNYMDGSTGSASVQDRNGIKCLTAPSGSTPGVYINDKNGNGTGGESDDGQNISCNYIGWADGVAYTDWAGLRPMSELEFEKSCRGTSSPVAGEYAWGSTSVTAASSIPSNPSTASEGNTTTGANVNYNGALGYPIRVGIFASDTTTTRRYSGASYYGIMDLSGDLWERVVSINDAGRTFTGSEGDGVLNSNGDETGNSDWPGTSASGAGFRGGAFDNANIEVSNRYVGTFTQAARTNTRGFRSVRIAP